MLVCTHKQQCSVGHGVCIHSCRCCLQLLVATGMRYLVAVDMRHAMWATSCGHCVNVSSAQAALLQTLCLLKAERDVTVLAFLEGQCLQEVQLEKSVNFAEAEQKIKQVFGLIAFSAAF
ncbi:hypothetical protein PR048_005852 [Dryococelus australis]|uniref:RNA-binding protein RO60 vWA domain-containing protein n=1 Tax=Dryococelus australis TaxID=614101 RepID=A0ABQ9I9D9_9NEOP|nr:hypothetical protein PR048_005852 [Dryococelus australis]